MKEGKRVQLYEFGVLGLDMGRSLGEVIVEGCGCSARVTAVIDDRKWEVVGTHECADHKERRERSEGLVDKYGLESCGHHNCMESSEEMMCEGCHQDHDKDCGDDCRCGANVIK